jgi:flagellar motor switch protein FliM
MSDQPDSAFPMGTTDDAGSGIQVIRHTGEKASLSQDAVQRCQFRHPAELSGVELRRIRQRYAEFVRALAARLSIHLRLEFAIKPESVRTLSYSQLIERFRTPTHLTLFKADPLRGVGILEMPASLSLLIVDRLLGGQGAAPNVQQELTPIEIALVDQPVQIILAEWCAQWRDLQEIKPVVLGNENNARFLQTAPSDTTMLLMGSEVTLGNFVERIQIAIPCATMAPVTEKLASSNGSDAQPTSTGKARPTWNRHLDDLSVPLTAEWQGLQLSVREIASLKVGDVLTLDPGCAGDVLLKLASIAKFRGTLGTCGTQWAVQVSETVGD